MMKMGKQSIQILFQSTLLYKERREYQLYSTLVEKFQSTLLYKERLLSAFYHL